MARYLRIADLPAPSNENGYTESEVQEIVEAHNQTMDNFNIYIRNETIYWNHEAGFLFSVRDVLRFLNDPTDYEYLKGILDA